MNCRLLNKIFIIIICISFISSPIFPQLKLSGNQNYGIAASPAPEILKFNSDNRQKESKDFLLPAVEVIGINMGVWFYNKYLTREGWSDIGFNTMKQNLKTGFQWDNDGFLMNQFAHPYHGSQYYNAARSNGLSFWESALYPYGGSLMWELFMENQAPSYNDFVNTPVSGILIGEVTYRISDLIIDESKTGIGRILTEAAALIVNPTRGFNRLIKGEMWRISEKKINPRFSLSLSGGSNTIFFGNKKEAKKTFALARVTFTYGDLMKTEDHKNPFDYFALRSELCFTLDDNISNSMASGVIWDKEVNLFNSSKDIIGIYKELELLINTIYKFTATQATARITSEFPFENGNRISINAGISGIFLGGVNSAYSSVEGKDYNLGPGLALGGGITCKLSERFSAAMNYKKFWIHTLSGAAGEEFAGYFNTSFNYHFREHSYFGLEFTLYHRHAYYDKYPSTDSYDTAIRSYYSFAF